MTVKELMLIKMLDKINKMGKNEKTVFLNYLEKLYSKS